MGRRSKSYERPINNNNTSTVNNNNPDIQSNYEEYDLSHMMETSNKVTGGRKKVSFQEEQPGSLRKMSSTPSLTGLMTSQGEPRLELRHAEPGLELRHAEPGLELRPQQAPQG